MRLWFTTEIAKLIKENRRLKFLNQEERQTIDELSKLCLRAADTLECRNLDHLPDDLIDELRKAANDRAGQ